MGSAHPSTDCCSKSSLGNILENYVTGAGIERKGREKETKTERTMSGLGWYHWLWIAVLLLILFRWMTRMVRGVPRAANGPSSSRRSSNLVFANTNNQQLESTVVHGRQGLPPYTSRGGIPSYIEYMAGFPPEPPPSWAPPSPYSQYPPPTHPGGSFPPQHSLNQLDVGALPTYEEAMRANQPVKTNSSNVQC